VISRFRRIHPTKNIVYLIPLFLFSKKNMPPKYTNQNHTGALGLLKTTIDPKRYNMLPPNQLSQPTFSKRIDVIGNIPIYDDATHLNPLFEKVPTQSGMIVWLPNQGVSSVYRFGFVPAGTVSTGLAQGGDAPLGPGINSFRYNKVLALPYNSLVTSDVLTVSPPLTADSLSVARLYSGRIKVVSDTVPIGTTQFGGYLTATSTGDVRNLFGTYTEDPYSPANMVQMATTTNDAIKEIGVAKGAVTLLGPDISPTFHPPNADKTDTKGTGTLYPVTLMTGFTTAAQAVAAGPLLGGGIPTVINFNLNYAGWITPYDIDNPLGVLSITGSPTVQNIKLGGGLNPMGGTLDISVNFHTTSPPTGGAAQPAAYEEQWVVFCGHVFACVSSNGGIYYTQKKECRVTSLARGGTFPNTFHSATFSARMFASGGFTGNAGPGDLQFQYLEGCGMYIGSMVNVFVNNIGGINGTQPATVIDPAFYYNTIHVSAHNDGNPGELGPCRAIRWDGLIPNSQLRVDGLFMAECVPGHATAPFTQSGETMARVCENSNAMAFLAFAYNSPETPFQRNYSSDEYEQLIREVIPNMGTKQLRQFGCPGFIRSAAAAGILTAPTVEDVEDEDLQGAMNQGKRPRSESMVENERDFMGHRSMLMGGMQGTPSSTGTRLRDLDTMMAPIERERSMREAKRMNDYI
jgi:hypothetical protein